MIGQLRQKSIEDKAKVALLVSTLMTINQDKHVFERLIIQK